MSNNIVTLNSNTEIFHFHDMPIRVVRLEGEPWFVAVDVCKALGLKAKNSGFGHHFEKLDKNETNSLSYVGLKLEGNYSPRARLITESGLYKLALRSDKETAKLFQNWVTKVVLPAIRKDGGYIMGEEKVATGELSEDEFILKAYTFLMKKSERLEEIVTEHLKNLTVNEWGALNHLYLTRAQRTRLGQVASTLCRRDDIKIEKQKRILSHKKGDTIVYLGVYPKAILDEDALIVGLRGTFSISLGISV